MNKPTILVTAASGKTGSATAAQLLEKGYPVRALVRTADARSERLRRLGADIFVGDMDDLMDVRQAVDGVQRAYYCPPFSRDALATSMTFAIAAQEHRLEMVTVMSQWLADPSSPSLMTRELGLADQLFRWMPDVATVTVNPGWFADNYQAVGLDMMTQLGVMTIPLGEGLNAPPSTEDIARVIVGALTNPAPHLGKTYRPTGPRLLSPQEIADSFGRALGRQVRYQDAPIRLVAKVARSGGMPDFQIAQLLSYFEEYRRNTFGVGAPTNAVLEVSGQEPEDFDTIARRYVAKGAHMKRSVSGFARVMRGFTKAMLTPGLDLDRYEKLHEFPQIPHARFAGDSPDWVATHGQHVLAVSLMESA